MLFYANVRTMVSRGKGSLSLSGDFYIDTCQVKKEAQLLLTSKLLSKFIRQLQVVTSKYNYLAATV